MTKTVQIERLIELLSSIAGKFAANPTMSHLLTDGVEDTNIEGLILKFDDCAKKTALKSFEADFIAFQDGTPTLEDPQAVEVWEAQNGFKFFMVDSDNNHESYLVPLKYISIDGVRYEVAGGHINVTTGVATITHVKEALTPDDDWHKSNTYDGSFYVSRNIKKSNTEFLCNYAECVDIDVYESGKCAASAKSLNFWFMESGTTTDEFKEWLSTHPIYVAYELNTSVQVQLDPVIVKTLNDTTCFIQTYQGSITQITGAYMRDIAAAIEAIENEPVVEINKEGVTPSENAETITIGNESFAVNGVEINKQGVTPSETLTTLTQGDTSYSFSSEPIVETIMGGLDREYGTTASNYIGTYNQWDSIDTGKSFADYDEILLICKKQTTPTYGTAIVIDRTDVSLLQHYDKTCKYMFPDGNNTIYVKYGIDYTNNKFYLENWNYCCPIALIGVKH